MTARLPLTRGRYTLVDAADVAWIQELRRCAHGHYAYVECRIGGKRKTVPLHRLIADAKPGFVVDHINGDTLDNWRANLRLCTHQQNMWNSRRRFRPGFKGVYRHRNSWRAVIMQDRKQTHLGAFQSEVLAARAYDRAAVDAFGEFASLNFSTDRDRLFPHEHAGQWPRLAD